MHVEVTVRAIDAAQRRRLQFSLRTLLVVVTVAALACAWLGANVRKTRQQQRFITQLTRRGFEVESHCAAPGWLQAVIGKETAFLVVDRVLIPVEKSAAVDEIKVGDRLVKTQSFKSRLLQERRAIDAQLVPKTYAVWFPAKDVWRLQHGSLDPWLTAAGEVGFDAYQTVHLGIGLARRRMLPADEPLDIELVAQGE